ncbi:hypothetical protein [Streptodolium elevatio]
MTMTDDLDRRLRGLVDDIEPAVVISPASETRARGTRRKLRHRTAAGVAAAAAAGMIATGFVALGGSDGRATGQPAGPTASCPPGGGPMEVKPNPSGSTASSDATAPPGGQMPLSAMGALQQYSAEQGLSYGPWCAEPPAGTQGPLSPKALRSADLPAVAGGWTQPEYAQGTWSGTAAENRVSPSVFCLPSTWTTVNASHPDVYITGVEVPPTTEMLRTSHSFGVPSGPGQAIGNVTETIATFATEAEAQAAEAKLAAAAATCQARYPGASLTQLGTADAPIWKWDHAPDSYRGYEGYIRSGKTIVVIGYLQGGPFATEFAPQILQTAIDRATG